MVSGITLQKAFQLGNQTLSEAGVASPRLETLVLLCFCLKRDKSYIHAHPTEVLSEAEYLSFQKYLTLRASHLPLQYITGEQEFMSLAFYTNPRVLIPRQDTEILVETILDKYKKTLDPLKILDIGTGSGCIAVSLAKYLKNATICATDISEGALETATQNALRHHVDDRIRFFKSNLFETLSAQKFDVIVSNPPYIPSDDIPGLMPEVRLFEPKAALDGGKDGLKFYRTMITKAPQHLNAGGLLALEAGIGQCKELHPLMEASFYDIEILKDLSGIERVICGRTRC